MTTTSAGIFKSGRFRQTPFGVNLCSRHDEIMICGPLDIVSRLRINMPSALPQSWMTLTYTNRDDENRQILILDTALDDEHYWALLGDLYQEGFYVNRGFEESVRDYLIYRLQQTHEFGLKHMVPVHSVYLSKNKPGRKSLYESFISNLPS